MTIVLKKREPIPLEVLTDVDEKFFRQIQMDGDKVLKKFKSIYESTKAEAYKKLKGECLYASFKIDCMDDGVIYLEQGETIKSKMLTQAFEKSEELIICAITMSGYEEMEEASDDFMNTLFYDGWGTAFADCGYAWLKNHIAEELKPKGYYATCPWSPGQHNVDIQLQKLVFRLINPEEIGITLNSSCLMHPKKSITGIFGISKEEDVTKMRACDFCEHRETCPSAYN